MTSQKPMDPSLALPAGFKPGEGQYLVNELFYSIQGEGALTGTPMVFVRLARCNLRCAVRNAGFDCDTEFQGFVAMTLDQLVGEIRALSRGRSGWALLTGGEPALQLDAPLLDALHADGLKVAIETNGTIKLPDGIDWICVSPKSAGHTIAQRRADEIKYVLQRGQALPELPPAMKATHHFVSPAFQPDGSLRREDLDHCLSIALNNKPWRLSLQSHKLIAAR